MTCGTSSDQLRTPPCSTLATTVQGHNEIPLVNKVRYCTAIAQNHRYDLQCSSTPTGHSSQQSSKEIPLVDYSQRWREERQQVVGTRPRLASTGITNSYNNQHETCNNFNSMQPQVTHSSEENDEEKESVKPIP